MTQVFKQKQLSSKVAFHVGPQGQFAVGLNDHRWYYTLDSAHYVGPYKRRILAQRAWSEHLKRQGTL